MDQWNNHFKGLFNDLLTALERVDKSVAKNGQIWYE